MPAHRRQTEASKRKWADYMKAYRASRPKTTTPRDTEAGKEPTPRQLEILKAYADPLHGGNQRRVATALGISPSAVHNQIARLLARLGVQTTTQAVWKLYVERTPQDDETAHKPVD